MGWFSRVPKITYAFTDNKIGSLCHWSFDNPYDALIENNNISQNLCILKNNIVNCVIPFKLIGFRWCVAIIKNINYRPTVPRDIQIISQIHKRACNIFISINVMKNVGMTFITKAGTCTIELIENEPILDRLGHWFDAEYKQQQQFNRNKLMEIIQEYLNKQKYFFILNCRLPSEITNIIISFITTPHTKNMAEIMAE